MAFASDAPSAKHEANSFRAIVPTLTITARKMFLYQKIALFQEHYLNSKVFLEDYCIK
jgi:hypothetical protein